MRRTSILALFAAVAIAAATFFGGAARAAVGMVDIVVMKVKFIIGGEGGGGMLVFEGREYPISVAGLSIGASAALSVAKLTGIAHNMVVPSDIEGTFAAVEAGAAVVVGAQGTVSFKNGKGVRLDLAGVEIGADLSLDVGAFTISID